MPPKFKNQLVLQAERQARRDWLKSALEQQEKTDTARPTDVRFHRLCAVKNFDRAVSYGSLLCC